MTINAWKTSFIGLNKPPKVLGATVTSSENLDLWPYAFGDGDPYWSGGVNPLPYRYKMTFNFIDQNHGSHLTRTPYIYNAQDIEVGDFVAGADDGKVMQVMSIESKSDYELVAVVEDRLRYNVYKTGSSIFNVPGNVVFFQINELGIPMLDPLPGTVGSAFYPNVMSRFQYMNPLTNYLLEKTAHGFEKGDAICIEDGEFVLSDPDNISYFIGTVVEPGPGPDQFILRPSNGIIDFIPGLPGDVGNYIYPSVDGTGDLTPNSESQRPVFMKIANAIETYTIGTSLDPVGNDGDVIEINKIQVSLYGSGSGTYSIDDAITLINNQTSDHKLTADKVNGATSVTSDSVTQGSAYGVVAGYIPFSAEINGTLVSFTTTTGGSAAYGDPSVADVNDMVYDINAASIPNITASVTGLGELVLTNTIGGEISITNISNDLNGTPWAGSNSLSSLAEYTAPNTSTFVLRLTREDGGPMTLKDFQGQFFYDAGVISGQNGRYALGLYIEQGLRSSSTTMVADIAARDALIALPGDQAYVIDAGNGEWAIYVYNGADWLRYGNQRSDATDARTIEDVFEFPSGNEVIGSITTGRRILKVSVAALTDLVSAPDFSITVGGETVWQYSQHGGSKVGIYSTDSDYITTSFSDVEVVIPFNSATGTFRVEVTYI